jgi:hypothetical protein
VFEIQGQAPTGVHVRLHAEKCIECEACWRTHTVVDWANLGPRRLRTAVLSPLVTRLLEAQDRAGPIRPTAPRCVDTVPEERCLADLPLDAEAHKHLAGLVEKLEHKLREFEEALSDGPAALDRPGSDHLELLARYAQEIAIRIHESIQTISGPVDQLQRQRVLDLVVALRVGAEERARRTWDGRFSWAVADGSLLRQHHLAQLRCLLGIDTLAASMSARDPSRALRRDWVPEVGATRVEDACLKHLLADIAARRYLLETLELAPRVEQGATQEE